MRIRSLLLTYQRAKQSGFTPGKSITHCNPELCILVERRHEFRQGILATYVDLKKVFDSVYREALWNLLHLRGIPTGVIRLVTGLYSGTESGVNCGGVGRVKLLSCEYGSDAVMHPCSITFQHMYGLGTGQSCGSKSL